MSHDETWFSRSPEYWKDQNPSINGMLGGYGNLAPIDEKDSYEFLNHMILPSSRSLALDCGAGIGRVSINVLLKIFDKVSLLECTAEFLETAKKNIPSERVFKVHNKTIQELECCEAERGVYDLVWFQWVLCYADDDCLCKILEVSKQMLKIDGYIGIKENICLNADSVFDEDDHSMIRSDYRFKNVFEKAGLKLVSTRLQKNFPKSLYPVRMYLLKPIN